MKEETKEFKVAAAGCSMPSSRHNFHAGSEMKKMEENTGMKKEGRSYQTDQRWERKCYGGKEKSEVVADPTERYVTYEHRYSRPRKSDSPMEIVLETEDISDDRAGRRSSEVVVDNTERIETMIARRPLYNVGSSCYMNSSLQALSSCLPAVARIRRLLRLNNNNQLQYSAPSDYWSLLKIVAHLAERTGTEWLDAPNGTEAMSAIGRTSRMDLKKHLQLFIDKCVSLSDTNENQDAEEFFSYMLGFLSEHSQKLEPPNETKRSPVKSLDPADVFEAEVQTVVRCNECRHRTLQPLDVRTTFSLPIVYRGRSEDLLKETFKWQSVRRTCTKEGCSGQIARRAERILKFPKCLVILVQRHEGSTKKKGYLKPSLEMDLGELSEFPEPYIRNLNDKSMHRELLRGGKPSGAFVYHPFTDIEGRKARIAKICPWYDLEKIELNTVSPREERPLGISDPVLTIIRIEYENLRDYGDQTFYRCISYWLTGSVLCCNEVRDKAKEIAEKKNITDIRTAVATLLNVNVYVSSNGKWERYTPCRLTLNEEIDRNLPLAKGSIYLVREEKHYYYTVALVGGRKPTWKRASDNTIARPSQPASGYKPGIRRPRFVRTHTDKGRKIEEYYEDTALHERIFYELTAAIVHEGEEIKSGHFVCYTREPGTHHWVRSNDEIIALVTEDEMLSAVEKDGYILFYTKRCTAITD